MIWPITAGGSSPDSLLLVKRRPTAASEFTTEKKKRKTQKTPLWRFLFIRILPQRFSLAQLRHPPSVEALLHTVPLTPIRPLHAGAGRRGSSYHPIQYHVPARRRAGRQRPLARIANVPL